MTTRRAAYPGGGLLTVVAVGILLAVLLGHSGKGTPTTETGTVEGRVGDLVVYDVYAPAQTTPGLASVYLRVRNDGAADRLLSATSDRAPGVQIMKESGSGSGVSSMTQQPDADLPAHQTVSLTTGNGHLMLVQPRPELREGQRVAVTMRFARNGTLTLQVPVTGIGGP